jgi:metal-responsive CopG/Arc/MetJ family transcriptional regulator
MGSRMPGRENGTARVRFSVTVDAAVLKALDTDADAMGLSRSELVEQALRNEHLRRTLREYTLHTASTLNLDSVAEQIYCANRAAGI